MYINLAFSFCQVLSLNETDYFFDSLRQITDWSRRGKRVNQGKLLITLLGVFNL